LEKKRILVIGGAGYIGSHVVYELCDQGYDVTIFDNFSTGLEENLDKRAKLIRGDILIEHELARTFEMGVDVIFHFAALKVPSDSMVSPELYSSNNIVGTLNILKNMVKYKIKYIIFSSTCAVYGDSQYLPIDENHPLIPINYYGFTKLHIEEQLNWYSKLKGIQFSALRYFNAAGYDIKGRIKGKEMKTTNLLPIIMKVASGEQKGMSVYGNDYNTKDGSCIRDYIHVNDLASAHILSMDYILENNKDLILNLATGCGYSVLEVINQSEKITGRKINYEIANRREGDPAIVIAKTNFANNLLCWRPVYSNIDTIIRSMWNVYKN